jgi:hypothetical protein
MMRRVTGGLAPCHSYDAERLDGYGLGVDLEVSIRQRRSLPQQRLYWVTLQEVVNATGDYPSAEALHEALKLALGCVRLMKRWDGEILTVPDSTAFAAMDGAAFKDFFDRAMAAIAERYGFDPLAEFTQPKECAA